MQGLRQKAQTELTQQTQGCEPDEVTSLIFTGCALLEPSVLSSVLFPKLSSLSLIAMNPKLQRIDNFPLQFSTLTILHLEDNGITCIPNPFNMPNLVRLLLTNNSIDTLKDVAPLQAGCPKLEVLDLFSNPVANETNYRSELFALCPSLRLVDNRNASGEEVFTDTEDDDDETDSDEEEDDSDEEYSDEEDSDTETTQTEESSEDKQGAGEKGPPSKVHRPE